MKYIIATNDKFTGIEVFFLESEKHLKKFLKDWEIVQPIDWDNLEKYDKTETEYIAYKEDHLGRRVEANLRTIKG